MPNIIKRIAELIAGMVRREDQMVIKFTGTQTTFQSGPKTLYENALTPAQLELAEKLIPTVKIKEFIEAIGIKSLIAKSGEHRARSGEVNVGSCLFRFVSI